MKNQILLLFFFISFTNCQFNDKNNEFEIVENQLRTHIQNNEWEDLFMLVKKYKSRNEIIFNPNFVVFDDSMSPRTMTYELFFEEYEEVVNELKKELKKSENIIF